MSTRTVDKLNDGGETGRREKKGGPDYQVRPAFPLPATSYQLLQPTAYHLPASIRAVTQRDDADREDVASLRRYWQLAFFHQLAQER